MSLFSNFLYKFLINYNGLDILNKNIRIILLIGKFNKYNIIFCSYIDFKLKISKMYSRFSLVNGKPSMILF